MYGGCVLLDHSLLERGNKSDRVTTYSFDGWIYSGIQAFLLFCGHFDHV